MLSSTCYVTSQPIMNCRTTDLWHLMTVGQPLDTNLLTVGQSSAMNLLNAGQSLATDLLTICQYCLNLTLFLKPFLMDILKIKINW